MSLTDLRLILPPSDEGVLLSWVFVASCITISVIFKMLSVHCWSSWASPQGVSVSPGQMSEGRATAQ